MENSGVDWKMLVFTGKCSWSLMENIGGYCRVFNGESLPSLENTDVGWRKLLLMFTGECSTGTCVELNTYLTWNFP